MRWSGLAIRDAVSLERRRLNEHGELFLYRAKTGSPVYVPLPPDVAEELRTIPPGPSPNPRYFFWSGNGSPKSVVGNWQRSFRRLFKIADLRSDDGSSKRCHPHMFRDTFAVEMLLAGVPLEQVSMLLGHKSVKITEKHYAPWVKARQEQLAVNVRKSWTVLDAGNKRESANCRGARKAPDRDYSVFRPVVDTSSLCAAFDERGEGRSQALGASGIRACATSLLCSKESHLVPFQIFCERSSR